MDRYVKHLKIYIDNVLKREITMTKYFHKKSNDKHYFCSRIALLALYIKF